MVGCGFREVPRIIELAADCVCALYERASAPDLSASETDRCGSRVALVAVSTAPQLVEAC